MKRNGAILGVAKVGQTLPVGYDSLRGTTPALCAAYYAAHTVQPTETFKLALNRLVKKAIAAGFMSKFDMIHFGTNPQQQGASLNFMTPGVAGSNLVAQSSDATFVPGKGFLGYNTATSGNGTWLSSGPLYATTPAGQGDIYSYTIGAWYPEAGTVTNPNFYMIYSSSVLNVQNNGPDINYYYNYGNKIIPGFYNNSHVAIATQYSTSTGYYVDGQPILVTTLSNTMNRNLSNNGFQFNRVPCAIYYSTSGRLSDIEMAAWHAMLNDFLTYTYSGFVSQPTLPSPYADNFNNRQDNTPGPFLLYSQNTAQARILSGVLQFREYYQTYYYNGNYIASSNVNYGQYANLEIPYTVNHFAEALVAASYDEVGIRVACTPGAISSVILVYNAGNQTLRLGYNTGPYESTGGFDGNVSTYRFNNLATLSSGTNLYGKTLRLWVSNGKIYAGTVTSGVLTVLSNGVYDVPSQLAANTRTGLVYINRNNYNDNWVNAFDNFRTGSGTGA